MGHVIKIHAKIANLKDDMSFYTRREGNYPKRKKPIKSQNSTTSFVIKCHSKENFQLPGL